MGGVGLAALVVLWGVMVIVLIVGALGIASSIKNGQQPHAAIGVLFAVRLELTAAGVVCVFILGALATRYLVMLIKSEKNLPDIVAGLKPVFLLHWQAPAGTAYQASMWLPYLERIGQPYFVLVRSLANFNEVVKLTKAPVILRVGLSELDPVICESLRVAFYVNTAVRNCHMIRFTQLQHIQLNHGDSDKIVSVNPTFRQYDKDFVAGQAAIDRFAQHGVKMSPDQFVIVGRPQLEDVQVATSRISTVARPTVLYAPTWSGFYEDSDYSSLSAGPQIVQALIERGCRVVFRPHPYARKHPGNTAACRAISAMLEKDGGDHLYGRTAETDMSVFDCFNVSDAMISDVSSVVSDYLISDKPFAMAAVSTPVEDFGEEFPRLPHRRQERICAGLGGRARRAAGRRPAGGDEAVGQGVLPGRRAAGEVCATFRGRNDEVLGVIPRDDWTCEAAGRPHGTSGSRPSWCAIRTA